MDLVWGRRDFRRAGARCGGVWVQLGRNSPWTMEATLPTFTLQPWSAPVSAFSLALCWEPRDHSDLPKVTQLG